jgi:hypothetical protein
MTQNTKGVVSQKRGAEDAFSLPTLGQLVEEERFQPLRALVRPVKDSPVNELGEELRGILRKKAGEDLELLLASFFGACDVCAQSAVLKRAHVGSGEESPGKEQG